jgi:hypothetical protein
MGDVVTPEVRDVDAPSVRADRHGRRALACSDSLVKLRRKSRRSEDEEQIERLRRELNPSGEAA